MVDGDTFDVTIEKADEKVLYTVERIRLADVDSPEIESDSGLDARDFTYAVLKNKRVYLDIDDLSGNGRDSYGRLICVVYLSGVYGQPIFAPNFNRLLVDSGHAKLERGYDRWDEYIDRLGPKLAHVHLSDNDGTSDQHLPLGSIPRSTTDWPKHVRKLKASGYDRTINSAGGGSDNVARASW